MLKKNRIHPAKILAALFLASAIATAQADTTNLFSTADTFIIDGSFKNNAGGHTHVAAGRDGVGNIRRGLFRFDTSGLPIGAWVTSATLRVNVVGQPSTGPVPSTFTVHRVTAHWGEGVKLGNSGSLASEGEATWLSRLHLQETWSGSGANGDFATNVSAEAYVQGVGAYTFTGTGLMEDVQLWADREDLNHGVLFRTSLEGSLYTARKFGSREGGQPAELTIDYVPLDHRLTSITFSNGAPAMTWPSRLNLKYDLLATRSLGSTDTFARVETDLPASLDGANVYRDPPARYQPAYPGNEHLAYRVDALEQTNDALLLQPVMVASNLVAPILLTHARDRSDRLFVADQTGPIHIIDAAGALLPTPFLDLTDRMTNLVSLGFGGVTSAGINPVYDERGLLGLTFHPDYATNGRFFVYLSSPKSGPGINHESIVAEFSVSAGDPDIADTNGTVLLRFDQPQFNHNGGALAFGPDGYLYIATGDGGGGGDQHGSTGNGQNVSNLLGKILRIDVDGAPPYEIPADNPFVGLPGADEIYAYGFRNPYRFSFDFAPLGSNTLIVADVGQNIFEEINVVTKGGNYGWRILEGRHAFDLPLADTLGLTLDDLEDPMHTYRHAEAGISVIGGYVYRGRLTPSLQGAYVFGDYSDSSSAPGGRVYYLKETRSGIWERFLFRMPGDLPLGRYIKGLGQNESGELYLLVSTERGPSGSGGEVLKITGGRL